MTLLLVLMLFTTPPDTLRLASCYREAEAHHPLREEASLQEAIADLKVRNLNTRFLPDLSFRGQATYQSNVPVLPLSVPGASIPPISKDQYRVSFNVDQLIYDGGQTARQRALEYIQRDLAQQSVAVEVYKLRDQVNSAFFGVLMQQAQMASLAILEEDLRARRRRVEAQLTAGVGTRGNVDVLSVELLKVGQQRAEMEAKRRASLSVLGILLGRPLPDDTVLEQPVAEDLEGGGVIRQRPEFAVFSLNRALLTEQERMSARQTHPRVSSFAEAAYGRPAGLDIFENTLQPFYSLGLRLQWPFWNWHNGRRERKTLALQRQVATAREAAFTQQIDIAGQQIQSDIARLEESVERDEEIIMLRERITAQAASQLDNGVITATEYLLERNAEYQARLTKQLHALQLLQARVQYLTTTGKS